MKVYRLTRSFTPQPIKPKQTESCPSSLVSNKKARMHNAYGLFYSLKRLLTAATTSFELQQDLLGNFFEGFEDPFTGLCTRGELRDAIGIEQFA